MTDLATHQFHLHLISDSSGETINAVARAAMAQFTNVQPTEHFWNLIRTERQLDMVLDSVEELRGLVMMTLVDQELAQKLVNRCAELTVPCIAVLEPVLNGLAIFLQQTRQALPGRQHNMDAAYFNRIEAMDFALANDDGQISRRLEEADVVLVGVSRSSKTPTCIYLGNRGIKAANIPYVPGRPLPPELEHISGHEISGPMIIGLTKDPDRLVQIRQQRLKMLNKNTEDDYADPEKVRAEVLEARRFFARRGWSVIDVTRRSIEETAAEIMMMLTQRRQKATNPVRTIE
jgi:regulator of PEP synthase PpsR (kinase-PPPase family)